MSSSSDARGVAQLRPLYAPAVILLSIVAGQIFGLGVALLVVAAGALCGGILFLWFSLQNLAGEAPLSFEEAFSLGAPSAEEEQKRAVLRALKDLEYEKAVGKINQNDYEALAGHYRAEARRLLQALDRDLAPERQRAEKELARRLGAAKKPAAAAEPATEAVDSDSVGSESESSAEKSDATSEKEEK